jgi:polynucleotide 5'-kinase involved in rRNA processing
VGHEDVRIRPGVVAGLNRDVDSDGLGIITDMDHDSITLKTPLRTLRGIRRVMLGSITFDSFAAE